MIKKAVFLDNNGIVVAQRTVTVDDRGTMPRFIGLFDYPGIFEKEPLGDKFEDLGDGSFKRVHCYVWHELMRI